MEEVKLIFFPQELIEQILETKELEVIDILNFGRTCSLFWYFVNNSNKIWKAKFGQMWPRLMGVEAFKHYTVTEWLYEFKQRWELGRRTLKLVGEMSLQHFKNEELSYSHFQMFDELRSSHKLALTFIIDELMKCIHNKDRFSNLTLKYYAEKTLRHFRQLEVASKWLEFKNAPIEEQILERGAVIVAQWSQPLVDITDQDIGLRLDEITEEVRKKIKFEYGEKHAALCVPQKESLKWRLHNIPDNYYSPHVSRQVIMAVSNVLFKDMGFHGDSELYYLHGNSYINKVLETRRGIPITLSILFESITRRLGVKCEPVSFPGHFLLRWRDSYKESNMQTFTAYIDVYNGGVFMGKDSCPKFGRSGGRCPMKELFQISPATAEQVVERMANNLEVAGRQRSDLNGRLMRLRSALELQHMVAPANIHCMMQLARFYMQYNMDVSILQEEISTVTNFDLRDMGQASHILNVLRNYNTLNSHIGCSSLDEVVIKRRVGKNEGVSFAVGMVMHHRQFMYTCVVIGWDPQCTASEEWITQMNVRDLFRQDRQPFYHVLVDDGTNRYAAEENLKLKQDGDRWVSHSDIGRYFDKFCHTHYLPNPEMLQNYPDDLPVLRNCLHLE